MSADRLFQYQALVEPFSAALTFAEDVTLDKWYQPPAIIIYRRYPVREGWFAMPPFALAQQTVFLSQWFQPPPDVTLPRRVFPPWLYTVNVDPIANPAAPDVQVFQPPLPTARARRGQLGGMVEPIIPMLPPAVSPFFIPTVTRRDMNSDRGRSAINANADIVNSLIRQGRITMTGGGEYDMPITQTLVTDALGYLPVSPVTQVIAGNGLIGGGTLNNSVTLSIDEAVIAALIVDTAAPVWITEDVDYTDLAAAALTNTITLRTVDAGTVVHRVVLQHITAFTGGAIGSYDVDIKYDRTGISEDTIHSQDVFAAPGSDFDTVDAGTLVGPSGGSLKVTAISTGANLNAATQGSFKLWFLVSVLPGI